MTFLHGHHNPSFNPCEYLITGPKNRSVIRRPVAVPRLQPEVPVPPRTLHQSPARPPPTILIVRRRNTRGETSKRP